MTKKIGCVIAYKKNHNNYGTSLQGYAMLKKIQQLGYQVEVINYIKRLTLSEKVSIIVNRLRIEGFAGISKKFSMRKASIKFPVYANGINLRTKAVNAYKKKKIEPFFHNYIGFKAIHEGSKNYDVVVVGSDQVWLPHGLATKFFNLLFVDDNVRKVAYSSSFGISLIPAFQKKATGAYLDRFHTIGVREQRGKEIVESLSHQKATVVADPTLLLCREEWEEEINEEISSTTQCNKEKVLEREYIFCYLISPNEEGRKQVKILSEKTGLPIITIRHMEQYREIDETIGDYAPYSVDPNDFVRYISKAKYVCTDSFHCSVFSIIFHRQFLTFYRSNSSDKLARNSRIDSLFNVLGVNRERIFGSEENDGNLMKIDNPIDWEYVDSNLATLRNFSISFLKKSLS